MPWPHQPRAAAATDIATVADVAAVAVADAIAAAEAVNEGATQSPPLHFWITALLDLRHCRDFASFARRTTKSLDLRQYGFVAAKRTARGIQGCREAIVARLLGEPERFVELVELRFGCIVLQTLFALVGRILNDLRGVDARETPVLGLDELGKTVEIVVERLGGVVSSFHVLGIDSGHYVTALSRDSELWLNARPVIRSRSETRLAPHSPDQSGRSFRQLSEIVSHPKKIDSPENPAICQLEATGCPTNAKVCLASAAGSHSKAAGCHSKAAEWVGAACLMGSQGKRLAAEP
jgi:hypothetical protein